MRGPRIDELKKAIALRPDLVEARVHLATYMLEAGNAAEAAPLLEGALRYDTTNVLAHLNLGRRLSAARQDGRGASASSTGWRRRTRARAGALQPRAALSVLATTCPGMTPTQAAEQGHQRARAVQEAAAASGRGANDDTDELITRAKTKKASGRGQGSGSRSAARRRSRHRRAGSRPAASQPARCSRPSK